MPRTRSYALAGTVLLLLSAWPLFHPGQWIRRLRIQTLSWGQAPLTAVRGLIQLPSGIIQAPALRRERDRLRAELKTVQRESIKIEELTRENVRLEKLLQLKNQYEPPMAAARVIGREGAPWFRTLLVSAGQRSNLREGNAVLAEGGLVGELFEVGPDLSRVLLISDARFRAAALVQRSRAQGMVLGSVQGRCYLAYITSQDAVAPGDIVVTSGIGATLPKGLLIGTVVRVDKDPSGLYFQALLKPAVDPARLEEVLCLP
ncbi:MAG: rod shape-determining protein MreC [Candidatus Omnitrophica bacterium]|nr:rod shape-determining protein MreC [Candidatus Omnitrophota bacterium]